MTALDAATDLRYETIKALEAVGIPIEYHHHEVAPSQHEIDMRYAPALEMADSTMTYRLIVKEVAAKHGVYATFMPKPLFGENGSGMHTHMSLFKDGRNQFFARTTSPTTSPRRGSSSSPGCSSHARELSAVFAQWVNSYKRLVPGYEAPVYVAWSQRNRSALVRIPLYKPGSEQGDARRDPLPRPGVQPVPHVRGAAPRGARGDRAGLRARAADGDEPLPPLGGGADASAGSSRCRRRSARRSTSSSRSELMRRAFGDHIFDDYVKLKRARVGRLPRPAHAVGARPLPLACCRSRASARGHTVSELDVADRSAGRCAADHLDAAVDLLDRLGGDEAPAACEEARADGRARRASRARCRTSGTRPGRRSVRVRRRRGNRSWYRRSRAKALKSRPYSPFVWKFPRRLVRSL